LLTKVPEVKNKKALLFSYGSGLCSSFLPITIHSNPLTSERIEQLNKFFEERISVSAE
jgi:3-hydroxy-3-methylglutaryl CoA synthase